MQLSSFYIVHGPRCDYIHVGGYMSFISKGENLPDVHDVDMSINVQSAIFAI